MKKVFIDSDIFVRDIRYPRDILSEENRQFLSQVKSKKIRGVTSFFNILEICGIISFNLSSEKLTDFYRDFCQHYGIQVLFPADKEGSLQYDIIKIFNQICKRKSLGDAQISYTVERFSDQLICFVSWNASHFEGKISIPALTPKMFLKQ